MLELFTMMPNWYQFGVVALFGAVMASFANVVAYRMHTNASLNGRSRCFSCGHTLSWYELVPVLSYLMQRGRCRACQARIPLRDLLVELVTAGLFVSAYILATSGTQLFVYWLLISLLVVVTLYDIEHCIIPNELVAVVASVGLGVFLWQSWPLGVSDVSGLLLQVAAAAGLYATLWKFSGGHWLGFGDVKLAAALGPLLTVEQAFSLVVLSFWIGAAVGMCLVYLPHVHHWFQRGRRLRRRVSFKSEIPFAPFITIAFLVVYMYDVSVLTLFTWSL